ncbi:hypothetical protein H6F38_20065 [Paenibacillus sp. EKM208P]|nr:hypothetical protein H6F38_20065 [Paenibacillus sp. EKM208P]
MEVAPERIAGLAERMFSFQQSDLQLVAYYVGIPSSDYLGNGATVKDNAIRLAEVAAQKGIAIFEQLERRLKREHNQQSELKPLHKRSIVNFGKLLDGLLYSVSSMEFDLSQIKMGKPPVKLVKKLRNANIEGTLYTYAIRCRNDIAYIRREAEKIGFQGYSSLQLRLQSIFVNVIMKRMPCPPNTAEDHYHYFVDFLYENCVPDGYRDLEYLDDMLAGIIFDTVAHCVIGWDKDDTKQVVLN